MDMYNKYWMKDEDRKYELCNDDRLWTLKHMLNEYRDLERRKYILEKILSGKEIEKCSWID